MSKRQKCDLHQSLQIKGTTRKIIKNFLTLGKISNNQAFGKINTCQDTLCRILSNSFKIIGPPFSSLTNTILSKVAKMWALAVADTF